jgi:hypothetical protein
MRNQKPNPIHAADLPADVIAFDADVTIDASAADGKSPATFDVLAYTGGPLMVAKYDHPVVVDLAGLTSRKVVVANLDHNRAFRVGHVTERINDGSQLRLKGIASAATPAREEVIASARDGFTWQASIEVAPKSNPVFIKAGKSVTVNGQTLDGPLYVARKSQLTGFAFLGQGADDNTSVKIAAEDSNSNLKGKTVDKKFAAWIEALGFDVAEITDAQRASLKKKYDAEISAGDPEEEDTAKGGDGDDTVEAGFDLGAIRDAHRDLVDTIDAKLGEHEDDIRDKSKLREIKATALEAAKALKQKAIKEKWSSDKFEIQAVREASAMELELVRAERPAGPAIHASHRDVNGTVIEAAMCQVLGIKDHEKGYDDKTLQAAHTAFRGRIGLQQVLIMAAADAGHTLHPGERLNNGNLRQVLRAALGDIDAAASTLSLPGILSNVANKESLAGYMEEDQTWREIATIKSVTDFKTVTSYRLLDSLEYEALGPNGEIKHGTVGEESYTRAAKTYAKMFGLTREDIINDDLGALDDLRTRLGRGAAKKFNNIFWAEFIDNGSFFTAGRTNYITGATTTLLTDGVGLGLAVKAIRTMTSPTADGLKRVGAGLRPSLLLVPPELEAAADVLYKATNSASVKAADVNIHAGKYRPVVAWQLSNSAFSGYSATAWYLFGDSEKPMVASFLNGVQAPTVESAEADFNTLGIQFRGYHDFGCDQAEYLSGIKSKGAA